MHPPKQRELPCEARADSKMILVEVLATPGIFAAFPSGRIVDLHPYGNRVPANIMKLEKA